MNIILIIQTLKTMTRGELRSLARKLGVATGRNKNDTVSNLTVAINKGEARFTLQFTVRPKGQPEQRFVPALFSKKLRTHKPNKVVTPIASEDVGRSTVHPLAAAA